MVHNSELHFELRFLIFFSMTMVGIRKYVLRGVEMAKWVKADIAMCLED